MSGKSYVVRRFVTVV